MSAAVKGFLIAVVVVVLSTVVVTLLNLAAGGPVEIYWAALAGGVFGLLYGLAAGILVIYDLSTPKGWAEMIVDMTWSLPNTIWGFIVGSLIFPIFGKPSRASSRNQGWIVYLPRSTTGFGHSTLQTHGTVNLGGAGQHEKMHVLQARIFGPLFLPI